MGRLKVAKASPERPFSWWVVKMVTSSQLSEPRWLRRVSKARVSSRGASHPLVKGTVTVWYSHLDIGRE